MTDDLCAAPARQFVPMGVVRDRLEAAGKWDALVAALSADLNVIKLLMLRDGWDPIDVEMRNVLVSIEADPGAILAL